MVLYPNFLPLPKVDGFSVVEYSRKKITDVQGGLPRIEKLFDVTPVNFRCSLTLTQEQYEMFDGFYAYELEYGVQMFEITLIVGAGSKTHNCYIENEPEFSQSGGLWNCSLSLIAFEKQRKTKDNYISKKAIIENFELVPQTANLFNLFVEEVMSE